MAVEVHQLQAILDDFRKEIHAQVQAQVGGRMNFLERRVASLEAKLDLSKGRAGDDLARSCCDLNFSARSRDRETYQLLTQRSDLNSPRFEKENSQQHTQMGPHRDFLMRGEVPERSDLSHHDGEEARLINKQPSTSDIEISRSKSGKIMIDALPESMYNYCMHRLKVSANPINDKALFWLIALIVTQQIVMVSFSVYNDVDNNSMGITIPDERDHAMGNCLFSNASLWGVPIIHYMIGMVSIVIVASVIKADSEASFAAPIPLQDRHVGWKLLQFARFWETIYMPGCFALEAATMFGGSRDALTIVTNTLQVTFIMEVDNLLYRNLLSKEEKDAYQAQRLDEPMRPRTSASWSTFTLNLCFMTFLFVNIVSVLGSSELYGEDYLTHYWNLVAPLYTLLFFLRFLLMHLFGDTSDSPDHVSKRCMLLLPKAALAAAFGRVMYTFSFIQVSFRPIIPPWIIFNAEEYETCKALNHG